jgi:DNA-binding HxlR family transcriptional regulator
MKKVFTTIAKWIRSIFAKQKHAELIKHEMSVEEKKQVVAEFNKSIEKTHKEILNVTVRDKKPRHFSKRKEVNVETPIGDFKLTKKQERFLDIISKSNYETGINMSEVCQKFLDFKYKGTEMKPTEDELKPNYHKKTINYLLKCGLIVKSEKTKNYYRVNY